MADLPDMELKGFEKVILTGIEQYEEQPWGVPLRALFADGQTRGFVAQSSGEAAKHLCDMFKLCQVYLLCDDIFIGIGKDPEDKAFGGIMAKHRCYIIIPTPDMDKFAKSVATIIEFDRFAIENEVDTL